MILALFHVGFDLGISRAYRGFCAWFAFLVTSPSINNGACCCFLFCLGGDLLVVCLCCLVMVGVRLGRWWRTGVCLLPVVHQQLLVLFFFFFVRDQRLGG